MIGKTISHYKIFEKLGAGGMGVVYKAQDTKLDRFVALKFLPPNLSRDEEGKKRFIHEAKTASALDHPNICTIYEIDETADGQMFIAMAGYEGETLETRINKGPLPVDQALDIATQISKGLSKAHEKEIVHRDIKPANIFITDDGVVKILDFGLAKLQGQTKLTKEGTTLGTTHYMSPEQVRGETLDQRTDIWALGAIIYEMLTGQTPFKGEYDQAVMYAIVNEEPDAMTGLRSGVPMELERIVNKCLEKNPENRYQHADDILVDLRKVVKESETKEILSKTEGVNTHPAKQTRSFILPGIIALIVLLLITGYFLFRSEEESGKKISIAVVDFVNETDEKELNGLSGLLITALEQSPRLSVLTRSRMFDVLGQLGKKDVDYINEKLGIEICKQANIEALAIADIRKLGNRYSIDLKVIDPYKNEHMVTAKEEDNGQENIFAMIDRLAEKTRKGLNEKAEEIQTLRKNVAEVTTTNLDAYEHYFRGEQLISKLKFNQAIEELIKAVSLDSTFALAWYRLGYAYDWNSKRKPAEESFDKALRLIDRIPEKERYLLHAQVAHLEGGYKSAIEILREGVKRYPEDKEILYNYGDFLYHKQRYNESIKYLEKVLEMDPGHERAYNHILLDFLAIRSYDKAIDYGKQYVEQIHSPEAFIDLAKTYLSAGKFDNALEIYRNGVQIFPEHPKLMLGTGQMYAMLGQYKKAEDFLKKMTEKKNPHRVQRNGFLGLGMLYGLEGKYSLAMNIIDKHIELYRQENNIHLVADYRIIKAYRMLWGRGKKDGVLKEVKKASGSKNPGCLAFNIHLAKIFVGFEDFEKADSISKQYLDSTYQHIIKAREFISKKEWEKAILEYKVYGDPGNFPEERYHIAQCYFKTGNWQKAIEETRLAQNSYTGFLWWDTYPKTFYLLGRIYEKKGDKSLAIENYEKLLDLWKDADKDLPDLMDAQKRLARLKQAI